MTDPYRIRSPETWAQARAAYLAGDTAEAVSARFGVSESALRKRAREEGWRRADQPDPEPLDIEDPDAFDPDAVESVDEGAMIRLAEARMAFAMRRGRVSEALRWGRLSEMIQRRAEHREQAEARTRRAAARDADALLRDVTASARSIGTQAKAALAVARLGVEPPPVQDVHPVHPDSGVDPTPLNRAGRRRLLKKRKRR